MNLRYQCIVTWTQVLPLVSTFTDDRTMPGKGEDDSILFAMMMNRRSSVWFGNHSRGADVWSQADQRIRSLHTLCLSTRDLEGRALLHDDWVLFSHILFFLAGPVLAMSGKKGTSYTECQTVTLYATSDKAHPLGYATWRS